MLAQKVAWAGVRLLACIRIERRSRKIVVNTDSDVDLSIFPLERFVRRGRLFERFAVGKLWTAWRPHALRTVQDHCEGHALVRSAFGLTQHTKWVHQQTGDGNHTYSKKFCGQ
jgi:hypothetical protein